MCSSDLVGYLLPLLATAYFGERLFAWMRAAPAAWWAGLAGAVAALAIVAWALSRRRDPTAGEPRR